MTCKQSAAALGFAFAAAWIGFSFGDAVLCLVGAGAFYLIASYREGELDLGELGERMSSQSTGGTRRSPQVKRTGTRVR